MIADPKKIARSYIRATKVLIIVSALFAFAALLDITIGIGWQFKMGDFLGSLGFLIASVLALLLGKAYFRWLGLLQKKGSGPRRSDQ